MATGPVPPTIPTVETGTSPREWSQSVLASGPAKDTPATFSEAPGKEDDPNMTEQKSRKESQALEELEKQQAQPSKESKPTTTRDQPSIGETIAPTAKQYVPEKTVEYATHTTATAASYLPIQHVKETTASYLCKLPPCKASIRADSC